MTIIETQTLTQVSRAAKKLADSNLTLRDLFAMSALNGIIGNAFVAGTHAAVPDKNDAQEYAESAYCIADAMLEARKKKENEL